MSFNKLRIVCIYTEQYLPSVIIAERCVLSGKKFKYKVEPYPAVYWKYMNEVHQKYNLKQRYIPNPMLAKLTKYEVPACRMANGTTHYLLYKWCVKHNKSICILEHDAIFVGKLPIKLPRGIIQISSHTTFQMNEVELGKCNRARYMREHQPDFEYIWPKEKGVVQHPLTGTCGTDGYIICPWAAKKMIEYIEESGIANADRLRAERVGQENLYLQIPQSVFCMKDVQSATLSRNDL